MDFGSRSTEPKTDGCHTAWALRYLVPTHWLHGRPLKTCSTKADRHTYSSLALPGCYSVRGSPVADKGVRKQHVCNVKKATPPPCDCLEESSISSSWLQAFSCPQQLNSSSNYNPGFVHTQVSFHPGCSHDSKWPEISWPGTSSLFPSQIQMSSCSSQLTVPCCQIGNTIIKLHTPFEYQGIRQKWHRARTRYGREREATQRWKYSQAWGICCKTWVKLQLQKMRWRGISPVAD